MFRVYSVLNKGLDCSSTWPFDNLLENLTKAVQKMNLKIRPNTLARL